jgi:2-polyprenyl-3-methyl-5-hydroxy-6-metoxy-1,4-benzoquinol methylase
MPKKQSSKSDAQHLLKQPLRTAKAVAKLPEHVGALYELKAEFQTFKDHTKDLLAQQEQAQDETNAILTEVNKHVTSIDERLTALSSTFTDVLKASNNTGTQNVSNTSDGEKRFADNHELDEFYVGFEDKFRGTEAQIKDKVKIYPEIVQKTGLDFKKFPVIDIGCGRGELLNAFTEKRIRAIGVDINLSMVDRAKKHGHEAFQGDAIEYLKAMKQNSAGAITGMHLVEHIPFEQLITLFRECYRVLTPGGIVAFETPNPENLMVGIYSFYMDPSHLHPLPPPLLGFALESVGFSNVEIRRLHDAGKPKAYDDPLLNDLSYRVYGPLDYAAIGTKPGNIQKLKNKK